MIDVSFASKTVNDAIQMFERTRNISSLELERQCIKLISTCSLLIGIVEGLTEEKEVSE